ncbi:efflux RND transporter permease subunit [Pirellulaceae bacterium SH449]
MSIATFAVQRTKLTWFATIILLAAGSIAYFQLGQLEDPEFTVKSASIATLYPGASAEEVELEVTNPLEIALQSMPQLKFVESISRPGSSIIRVEVQPRYRSAELPQIWDELRKKIRDATPSLPPGVQEPIIGDDFGDVFGFLLAVTRDEGFTDAELERYVDEIKLEMSLISGVARVELWGVRRQCIYVDVPTTQLTQLGMSLEQLQNTLARQNLVVQSGGVELTNGRLRIEQTGTFASPEDIGDLAVSGFGPTPGPIHEMVPQPSGSDELIRLRDIGQVRRGYIDPPQALMRYNGRPAIGVAISNAPRANIVQLGSAIDRRLAVLFEELPVGIELHRISWQSRLVDESIRQFMVSLLQAVAIVLVVLWVAIGLRTAIVVGLCGLVFVILMSFLVMQIWGIDLQRMSLGALIIAMGMMVDNAIVVVDGILSRIQKGMNRIQAAVEAATLPSMPLLGATVIAVMAFYPIYASTESAGEYCASLFQVVAASLLLSWVLSVTITPLMAVWLLPRTDPNASFEEQHNGFLYLHFKRLLALALRHRWLILGSMTAVLALAVWGFRFIDRTFFPDSARLQIMVDYWAPQGTRIEAVSEDLRSIERHLLNDETVESVSSYIGQGPPRFYLPVEPEKPYASYAQLIVNVKDLAGLNRLIPEFDEWAQQNVPEATVIVRRYGLGPSKTWTVEGRLSGPGTADLVELRRIADQMSDIVRSSPHAKVTQHNWRQRELKVVVDYNQERGRWSGISRDNIARATRRAYDGFPMGQYREGDKLLPILMRSPPMEREQFAGTIPLLQVHPSYSSNAVPLSQVVDGVNVQWEDSIIWRRDRRRTITIQARTADGVPASALRDDIQAKLEAVPLPSGYRFEWGGEWESSRDAQQSLLPGIIPAAIIVAITIVALFNSFRPPLIIALLIPFALIGVTLGLLITGQPFGFLALLGAMSLAGMMIKNAIVLLDQINIERNSGRDIYDAIIEAATSRLRPVLLAAGTTVLGVVPLLQDVFWVAMAVTIMFGLAFGTILTMILLPILYACLYRAKPTR